MEFLDVLKSRRSVRAFTPEPVSEEQIGALLEAFTWAPSPLHQQPWEFIILTDDVAKSKVRDAAEAAQQAVIDGGGPGWAGKYSMSFVSQAPALIVVLYDPRKGGLGSFFNQPHGALASASAGIQNLMLAAAEMGLGSLWFTFFDPEAVKAALGVPADLDVAGVIPVGRPVGELKPPPRNEATVHQNSYGG